MTSRRFAPMPTQHPLRGFIVRVFAWLPATFVVWYLAAPALMWPAGRLAAFVARTAFGDIVRGVAQSGAVLSFTTALRPGSSGVESELIGVEVNLLVYGFGLPMYAALVLAARDASWVRHLAVGYAALVPVVAWGALADLLKSVAITAGPFVASQTGFVPWQREIIAFAYQLGALILPTVVPAVVWVLMHRAFLERLRDR